MSKIITIRKVPNSLHRTLKTRAGVAGMSLSEFLLAEIHRLAERPTVLELRERLRRRPRVAGSLSAAKAVRRERDGR